MRLLKFCNCEITVTISSARNNLWSCTLSHRECGQFCPYVHENFEKFKIISTPTGSWIRSRQARIQLPVGVEIILSFSKFGMNIGTELSTLSMRQYRSVFVERYVIATKEEFYKIAGFPGVCGVIDGTHIRIQFPRGPRVASSTFEFSKYNSIKRVSAWLQFLLRLARLASEAMIRTTSHDSFSQWLNAQQWWLSGVAIFTKNRLFRVLTGLSGPQRCTQLRVRTFCFIEPHFRALPWVHSASIWGHSSFESTQFECGLYRTGCKFAIVILITGLTPHGL